GVTAPDFEKEGVTAPDLVRVTMASVQISSDPAPECQTMALEHDSLSPGRNCQENVSHGDKTELVYPEYIPPEDDVFPAEEQPLLAAASPTADSPGYIPESDPEDDDDEDPEEDPADSPADHDDDEEDEEPSRDDADEEDEEQDEEDDEEEEDHPALADSIPPPPALPMPITPPSPLTPLSSSLPQIPSPPQPASPPILPIPLPTASPPLQLLSSDRESSAAAAARPIKGRRADYGFVGSVEAEIKRQIVENIGYGIRDTWIDLRDIAEEEALRTLEGVNTRVTELAAVQEQDTQDIYEVMEDAQGRQTEMFQRVEI
nr:hypothetical protein [Tanacetum cinerariifolium]